MVHFVSTYEEAVKAAREKDTAYMASCIHQNKRVYAYSDTMTSLLALKKAEKSVVVNYQEGHWLIAEPTRPEELDTSLSPYDLALQGLEVIAHGLTEAEWLHSQGLRNSQNFETQRDAKKHIAKTKGAIQGPPLTIYGAPATKEFGVWEPNPHPEGAFEAAFPEVVVE